MRVALVTSSCPDYRLPLYREMSKRMDLNLILTSRGTEWYRHGFKRRGFLEGRRALTMGAAHATIAATVFGAAAFCEQALASESLVVALASELATSLAVCIAFVLERAPFPGGRVLERRVGEARRFNRQVLAGR